MLSLKKLTQQFIQSDLFFLDNLPMKKKITYILVRNLPLAQACLTGFKWVFVTVPLILSCSELISRFFLLN